MTSCMQSTAPAGNNCSHLIRWAFVLAVTDTTPTQIRQCVTVSCSVSGARPTLWCAPLAWYSHSVPALVCGLTKREELAVGLKRCFSSSVHTRSRLTSEACYRDSHYIHAFRIPTTANSSSLVLRDPSRGDMDVNKAGCSTLRAVRAMIPRTCQNAMAAWTIPCNKYPSRNVSEDRPFHSMTNKTSQPMYYECVNLINTRNTSQQIYYMLTKWRNYQLFNVQQQWNFNLKSIGNFNNVISTTTTTTINEAEINIVETG